MTDRPAHSGGPAPGGSTGPRHFATTRWSIVLAAGGGAGGRTTPAADAPEARDALAWLCRTYWYPLYAFVRSRGYGPEESQDLTQGFFARLLEKNVLRAADPGRGRFRSFLLASLKHFVANEWDRARAAKRGGGEPVLSIEIDVQDAERRYGREPADVLTPERVFERNWALTLLDTVLSDLQSQYHRDGNGELFDRLKGFLTGDAGGASHAEIASAAGMTEGAVQVAVHRLRKRYRDLLREHIGQTVASPDEVEEEIRDLFKAVRG
jgi:RNA polymerase sigma-70 factor (ECF subfamily)